LRIDPISAVGAKKQRRRDQAIAAAQNLLRIGRQVQ
jgi:hypothetical protein